MTSEKLVLPTFIVAGAPRSGTTYLYDLLNAHPDIWMARPRTPEPKFFLVDDEFHKGLEAYSKLFAPGVSRPARGEKSTNYLESSVAAERIHKALPSVKLVFVLRNPVERAYSNYRWSVQNGLESLPFVEAIQCESEREATYEPRYRFSRPFSYVSRGMYANLLEPYFERFPRDQLHIILLDDIQHDARQAAGKLFRFLEVDDRELNFDFARPVNQTQTYSPLGEAERVLLEALYEEPNRKLSQLLGRDLHIWSAPCRTNC